MEPTKTLQREKKQSDKETKAFEHLIYEVKNDADATEREKIFADALIALRNS